MRKLLTQILLNVLMLFVVNSAKATHIMSADISYICLDSNRYEITLVLYRDCQGVTLSNTTQNISFTSVSCGLTATATLNRQVCPPVLPWVTACEISAFCETFRASSCCVSNVPGCLPNAQRYEYKGVVTLPAQCSDWIGQTTDIPCCRNSAIDNLVSPGLRGARVEILINNSNVIGCNSSPQFSSIPVPFIPNMATTVYDHGAIDYEGDSLNFVLITPLDGSGVPIPYEVGYSAGQPLSVSSPTSYNANTGLFTVNPNVEQNAVVVFRVEEYRDGVLIGYTTRDMQFVVLPSTLSSGSSVVVSNLVGVSGGVMEDTVSILACPGSSVSASVLVSALGSNVTAFINMDSSGYYDGMSWDTTYLSYDSVMVNYHWMVDSSASNGVKYFTVNAHAETCPYQSLQSKVFRVVIGNPEIDILEDTLIYCGGLKQIPVNYASTGSWTPASGLQNNTLSNTYLDNPVSSRYYTFSNPCGTDSVYVKVLPSISMNLEASGDTFCFNEDVQLTAHIGNAYAPYNMSWEPSDVVNSTGTVAGTTDTIVWSNVTRGGYYYCTATAVNGCEIGDSVWINADGYIPNISAWASESVVNIGGLVELNASVNPLDCGLLGLDCSAAVEHTIDMGQAGTVSTVQIGGFTAYPGIYGNSAKSARHQILYDASDLIREIGTSGVINQIAFETGTYIAPSSGGTDTLYNFTIKMGCTNDTDLTSWQGGLRTVYGPKTYIADSSWNEHPLDNSFSWDGTSNLIVEICFYNENRNSRLNQKMKWHDAGHAVMLYTSDNAASCYSTRINTETHRPNTRFSVCENNINNGYIVSWEPSSGVNAVNDVDSAWTTTNPQSNQVYTVTVSNSSGCQRSASVAVAVDSTLSLTINNDTVLCDDVDIQLQAMVGGTGSSDPSLSIFWYAVPSDSSLVDIHSYNPMVHPQENTTYYAVVSNSSGDTITRTVNVLVSDGNLPLNAVIIPIRCNGESNASIYLNPTGIAPFSYTWGHTAMNTSTLDNMAAGVYYVTVSDAATCTASDSFEIINPSILNVDATVLHLDCPITQVGSLYLFANGGVAPYQFHLNGTAVTVDTINMLNSAWYQFSVTDANGCGMSDSIFVPQSPNMVLNASIADVACKNDATGSIAITVVGGTPAYLYNWSTASVANVASGLADGAYRVTVTDSVGCEKVGSYVVSEPATEFTVTPMVTHASSPGASDGQISLICVGGSVPYTFVWSSGATSNTLTELSAGTYSYTATDSFGCERSDTLTVVDTLTGIENISLFEQLRLYPNPTDGRLNLEIVAKDGSLVSIFLCNALGEKIRTFESNTLITEHKLFIWSMNNLSSGIYFIRIQSEEGSVSLPFHKME